MPDMPTVQNNPQEKLIVNFVGKTPHVFAYRFWHLEPGQSVWTEFHAGHTQDDMPDHTTTSSALQDGTQIAVVVALGGKKNSRYEFLLIFSHAGVVGHGGAIPFSGTTDKDGAGAKVERVILV